MRRKKAFTLVELLVVISIIALLVSILMPALGKARSQARRVLCSARMHDLGTTVELYKSDNDGYFPSSYWSSDTFNRRIYYESLVEAGYIDGEETVPGNSEWVVPGAMAREAYSCPSFISFLRKKSNYIFGWGNPSNISDFYPIGFGYNSHLSRYNIWDAAANAPARSSIYSLVGRNPGSGTLLLLDSTSFSLTNVAGSNFYPVYEVPPSYLTENGIIAGSHPGGFSNSMWVDTHVETRRADKYSMRDPADPITLVGASVLDGEKAKFNDLGYLYSNPQGQIASP